jgi:hypothetical protein
MPAFERGGIVPDTGLAMVHAREMVLPEHISSFIQGAAAGAGASGAPGGRGGDGGPGGAGGTTDNRTFHQHNKFEIHQHGGTMEPDEIVAVVRKAARRGVLSWG